MSRDVICVVWLDYADTNNYVLVENLVCVHCVVTNHFLSGPFLWSVSWRIVFGLSCIKVLVETSLHRLIFCLLVRIADHTCSHPWCNKANVSTEAKPFWSAIVSRQQILACANLFQPKTILQLFCLIKFYFHIS